MGTTPEFKIICRSDRSFINIVFAAISEDILFDVNESKKEIVIPLLEAFRTGIPEIRKLLKSREILLRCQYFDWSDDTFTKKIYLDLVSTSTAGNLQKIDLGYKNGSFIRGYIHLTNDDIFLYNDYKVVFLGNTREPTLRYKPVYTKDQPIYIPLQDFIKSGGSGIPPDKQQEAKILCKILPKLIKCSP